MSVVPSRVSSYPVVFPNVNWSNNFLRFRKDKGTDGKSTSNLILLKKIVNYSANGSACLMNLLTFLNGNFHFFDSIQEKLENFREIVTKIGMATVASLGSIDLFHKKNFVPFIGYSTSVPIYFLSSMYDLFVTRSFSEGLSNFIVVIDQREIVDDKGEPLKDKEGNVRVVTGDFSDKGWWYAAKTTALESIRMFKELCQKPGRIKKVSHSWLIGSLLQMTVPFIGLFGEKKLQAFVRDFASIGLSTSLLLHKNIKNNSTQQVKKFINLSSPFAQAAVSWIISAGLDYLKRFDFFSDKINNLTALSLAFDRISSLRYTDGLLSIKK